MKRCELCHSLARIYCESDQASLCWTCDSKVHGANFLVARHSRTLFCQACQCPTPWSAAGAKLGPTVSLCNSCSDETGPVLCAERESCNGDEIDLESDLDEGSSEDDENEDGHDEEEDDDSVDDDDEGENQVVPRTSTPPPQEMSSCSSEGGDYPTLRSASKRNCECSSDLGFQGDLALTASLEDGNSRPLKERRTEPDVVDRAVQGRTGLIKDSIERIKQDIASGRKMSAGLVGLCKLCRGKAVV